jgi:hypothetical protein
VAEQPEQALRPASDGRSVDRCRHAIRVQSFDRLVKIPGRPPGIWS